MKAFAKTIFWGAMLLSSQVTVANSGLSSDVPITVTANIQGQISKLTPAARKHAEEAIKTGNEFIPHHFDGTAYDNGDAGGKQELKRWQQNIRPLVDKDVGQWYTFSEIQSEAVGQLRMEGLPPEYPYAAEVTVCPQIDLVSIAVPDEHFDVGWKRSLYTINFADDSFELIYRTKIIGAWTGLNPAQIAFVPANKDESISVLIGLNKNNKVSRVMSEYALAVATPKREREILLRYISGVWSDFASANDKTRLKQMIKKMKIAEDKVCTDKSTVTAKPSAKE